MTIIYTPVYAALLALIILLLAFKVVLLRRKHKVGIGTKGERDLAQAVRVHANAIEYVPITLIVMVCAEWLGAGALIINICGACLLFGRILHAYGLGRSAGVSFGRYYGTIFTWLAIVIASMSVLLISAQRVV
ncbi:MAG: MAPEG family protein [Kangiellaceae bacterium]|nr:MAPEG family protein [Kangiellaceae bacterium]